MKVAIVYDRVNKWGGAERVLLALHEIFPKAPLYTSVYDPINAPWAKVFPKVVTSFLQKFPIVKSNHEFFAPLMPLAFESFNFDDYDLVISVTSEAAKGIITKPGTTHICYCLTPTRYLWSGYHQYFENNLFRFMTKPAVFILRKWDKKAAQKPNEIIAISTEVQKRIKKYYGRDSKIIFPPVDKLQITNHKNQTNSKKQTTNSKYYLLVGRLVGYKKVDLAIKAFNKLKTPLVIVGTGREERKLKKMAKPNIFFAGKVTEEELHRLYTGARALIMPQEEDFGIVSTEAQSFGVPVIAYKKGGALDTVIDRKTGIFFERQTPESLTDGIVRFEKIRFVVDNLYTNSKRFSKDVFKKEVLELISKNSSI